MKLGVCGADGDVIVARNFARFITGGSAGHSDHGRDLVEVLEAVAEGKAPGYAVRVEAKLRRIAAEVGVANADTDPVPAVAAGLADVFFADYGSRKKAVSFMSRVPKKRRELWDKLRMTPRGIDREIADCRLLVTGKDFHQRRFASTVFTEQTDHPARLQRKTHSMQDLDLAETLTDGTKLDRQTHANTPRTCMVSCIAMAAQPMTPARSPSGA